MRGWKVRGSTSVHLLVGLAAEHGLAPGDCLRGSGIAAESLEDPRCEIEASQELAVVRNMVRALGHVPGIGLEAGRRYRITGYGIFGYALLSSRSLRSAVEYAIRNLDLTFALTHFHVATMPDGLFIGVEDRGLPDDCRQFLVERDTASAAALCRQLLAKPLPARRTSFHFERPAYARRFAEIFLGPVFFADRVQGMEISTEWADLPLPHADERTLRVCQEQCREILDRRQVRTRMSERVRQHLLRPRAGAEMEKVAAELAITPRTLRRHLVAEGTSFRQLVDEVRATLAEEMLAHGMTVEEVAERLGYADGSSFVHAFKRWKGMPPRSYRQQTDSRHKGRKAT